MQKRAFSTINLHWSRLVICEDPMTSWISKKTTQIYSYVLECFLRVIKGHRSRISMFTVFAWYKWRNCTQSRFYSSDGAPGFLSIIWSNCNLGSLGVVVRLVLWHAWQPSLEVLFSKKNIFSLALRLVVKPVKFLVMGYWCAQRSAREWIWMALFYGE